MKVNCYLFHLKYSEKYYKFLISITLVYKTKCFWKMKYKKSKSVLLTIPFRTLLHTLLLVYRYHQSFLFLTSRH